MHLVGHTGIVLEYAVAVGRGEYHSGHIAVGKHRGHGVEIGYAVAFGYEVDCHAMIAGIGVDHLYI